MTLHSGFSFAQSARIKQNAFLIALLWTLLVTSSAIWALYMNHQSAVEAARIEARATFDKDLLYRRWAAMHGGVYVPVTAITQPNPYLEVSNRDLTTTDGTRLTLINPAYMTRQVHELAQEQYGTQGHITSLNPLRPANAADEWETEILLAFEEGLTEYSSTETVDDQPTLRYMHQIIVEQSCMSCHETQGYEIGDIRGGISVSVPLQPYWDSRQPFAQNILFWHGLLWLAGIGGVGISLRRILRGSRREEEATCRLQESEARLRSLIQSQTAFVIRTDMAGHYTYVNASFAAWYGLSIDRLLEMSVLETIDLIDHDRMHQAVTACLAQPGQPIQVALRKRLANNSIHHTLWEFLAITDTRDMVIEIQCMGFDITHQVELEESLRLTEERYRSAVNASLDAFYLLESVRDDTGTIVDFRALEVNDNAVRQMGLPKEKLVGGLICEMFPINRTNGFFDRYVRVVETGEPLEEAFYIDQTQVAPGWYQHQVVRVGDGVAIITRDITERREMEERLRKSEESFRTLAENSPDIIQRFSVDGVHLYANTAYARLIGLPIEQIIGKTNAEIGISPQHADFFEETHMRVFRNRAPLEVDFIYPSRWHGKERHYNTHVIPEFDAAGKIISLLAVSRDTTENLKAQQQAFELALAKERRQVQRRFIQDAAHEFRTPLAIISAGAYLMSRTEDQQQRAERAKQIETHVLRITRLVDMLLMMIRLDDDDLLDMTPVALAPVLAQICHAAQEAYPGVQAIRCDVPHDLKPVQADPDYLTEALQQIIDNACRFTPPGGTVTVTGGTNEGAVTLEICDAGPGIPDDVQSRIFDTFWRHDDVHSTPGFGLGLTIARRIIEMHGGAIVVESTVGSGTCIHVVLMPV
ncbi:MAG: PAS domain-containing protein [Phototrophicaceae bacterium]